MATQRDKVLEQEAVAEYQRENGFQKKIEAGLHNEVHKTVQQIAPILAPQVQAEISSAVSQKVFLYLENLFNLRDQ